MRGQQQTQPAATRLHRLTADRSQLAARHWDLALRIAGDFRGRYPACPVDWEGEAGLGLVRAALTWEPEGGVAFRQHARRRIRGACLDAMRATRVRGYGRSRRYEGAPVVLPLVLAAARSGDLPVGWEAESEDGVRDLLRRLPRKHGRAMRLLYLGGMTQVGAAEALGVREGRVCQLHAESIDFLRESLSTKRSERC